MIKTGMKLTCQNGHHIATVAKDMPAGGKLALDMLTDWQIPRPAAGDDLRPCHCGADFIRSRDNRLSAHFEGHGWQAAQDAAPAPIAYDMRTVERLTAEIVALRIVLSRLLCHAARHRDPVNYETLLAEDHACALDDLTRVELVGATPASDNAMRAHAQSVLDDLYMSVRPGRPT